MKRITVDLVMSYNPCYDRKHIEKLFNGKTWLSPLTVLKMDSVSYEDKLWLLLRNEFISDKDMRLFACDCAEKSLPIFEKQFPKDTRPRKTIETARLFANGNASQEELDAARDAAWAAARDAAWAAARAAARDAAWAVARAAARDAAREWQLAKLAEYLGGVK